MMIRVHAKANLTLRVGPRREDGFHPLRSLAQSVSWSDTLHLEPADDDLFTVDGPLDADERNLAWRAVSAVRERAISKRQVSLSLEKRIPVAAGLGGGSADAAGALVLASDLFRTPPGTASALAPGLGSDVPFCLVGGTAWMEGRGEEIESIPPITGYSLGVAVPPFPLDTPSVFRQWDLLDGPQGDPFPPRAVPPVLRGHEPLVNDLTPAARALRPELGDWMTDLAGLWGRPVALSGSGPAVFAFFADEEEASAAVAEVVGARAARAVVPVSTGWERADDAVRD